MKTVKEFADFCRDKTHDEIYEAFEYDLSDELRNEIFKFADDDSPEPCRSAMNKIGSLFNVTSLELY